MSLELLTALRKERLHEGAVAQIKEMIASATLQVGKRLPPERELARQLQVSRVVVREALRSLEQSGFLEVRLGAAGGAFVTHNPHKPLSDSVRDLVTTGRLSARHFCEARRAIECAGVEFAAARATVADVERLRTINQQLLEDLEDNTKLRRHNAAFHAAIADISGNPLIKLMVESLMDLLDTVYPKSVQSAEFIRNTFDRHAEIIDAIERRDVALCGELMARDTEVTVSLER